MASQDELLERYQRELTYLRQMGAGFAARYPKIAARLDLSDDQCADPHVERLIEAFAFLTARLQHRLDGQFPELSAGVLGVLYPQFTTPLPSMAIARFEVDPERGRALGGYTLPAGTPLFAHTQAGQVCRFRSCYPVELWPLRIASAQLVSADELPILDSHANVARVIRLRIEGEGVRLSELGVRRLRLHLAGEGRAVGALYDLLSAALVEVLVLPDGAQEPLRCPPRCLRPVGFDAAEAVIPAPPSAHPAFRLLQEYFTFPQKFHFFDLELPDLGGAGERVEVLLLLSSGPRVAISVDESNFRLGCAPIINLFPRTTEPIRLDHRRCEYLLVPDKRQERTTEIHSVLAVSEVSDPAWPEVIEPFFSYRHPADGEQHRSFYSLRREPTGRPELPGTEVYLSFLDLGLSPRLPAAQTVYAHTLCTNRGLAAQMPVGAELQIEEVAPLLGISCLTKPTAQVDAPLGGWTLWRLVSHLSLNHLSLSEGPEALRALREILQLYRMSGDPSIDQQLLGLVGLSSRRVVRRIGADAWRGYCKGLEVTLEIDEARYVGLSPLLLSAVLSRFLSMYAAINSFVEVVVTSNKRQGVWKRWPPMAGEQPLL